jgi:DNA-binding MarR family transcriptional regulator
VGVGLVTESNNEPRWLSAPEQSAWRAWLDASRLLNAELNRDLLEGNGLSIADYEILVQLSESPERRMRMSELAERTLASRSRLSHQIDRMEKAGFVTREACKQDARGFWAVLTEAGYEKIVAAAPDHVESVRRHLVSLFSEQDFLTLGEMCSTIVRPLELEK